MDVREGCCTCYLRLGDGFWALALHFIVECALGAYLRACQSCAETNCKE